MQLTQQTGNGLVVASWWLLRLPAKQGSNIPIALLSILVAGCGGPDAYFRVEHATGFASGPTTVSVLGVFKDGLMNQDTWAAFAPEVSRALDQRACDAGYGEELRARNLEAFSTIEQQAGAGGVGDELLQMIAPAARGDFILVFQMYGRPPALDAHDLSRRVLIAHGGGAEPIHSDVSPRIAAMRRPALDISASLFSIRLRRTVALLSMEYTGPSTDAAIREFARKLGSTIPGASCSGWDWTAVKLVIERDDAGLPLGRGRLVPVER
jgi:hypothetical protein